MFFGLIKTKNEKRIKELENCIDKKDQKLKDLENWILSLCMLSNPREKIVSHKIETLKAIAECSIFERIPQDILEKEIARKLGNSLVDYITFSERSDFGKKIVEGKINIVVEKEEII